MTLQELFAYMSQQQQNPQYAPRQVAGGGILGQGLQNQAQQIEQQTSGVPAPAPQGGLLGTAPAQQQMSPPPAPTAGAASKEAIIASVLQSGDPVQIAQLRKMGWIK